MNDEKYMKIALEEATKAFLADEVPVGCVIVCGEEVIAQSYNQKKRNKNALHHAEILALKEAMKKMNSPYLEECEMYVTLEPCMMCTGAIIHCRLKRVVFATREPKGGAMVSSICLRNVPKINHYPHISEGIYQTEASELLKKFFQKKRTKNKLT